MCGDNLWCIFITQRTVNAVPLITFAVFCALGTFLLVCFGEMPRLQVETTVRAVLKCPRLERVCVSAFVHEASSESTFVRQLTAKTPPHIVCAHFNSNRSRTWSTIELCCALIWRDLSLFLQTIFIKTLFCLQHVWISKQGMSSTITTNTLHATLIHVSWAR